MAGLHTDQSVALIVAPGRGLQIGTYKSKLDLIIELLGSGSIGKSYYGSPEHLAALDQIEQRLAVVRRDIAAEAERDA